MCKASCNEALLLCTIGEKIFYSGTSIPATCDQSNGKKCCSKENKCTSDCNCDGCIDYDFCKFNPNHKIDSDYSHLIDDFDMLYT